MKKLGVKTIHHDHSIAFICYLPKFGPRLKYGFFTESFSEGWGTVSDLNETTRIVTLYTSEKNADIQRFRSFTHWHELLSQTQLLKKCLPQSGNYKIIGKQANSSIPECLVGKNWLAIGDAALAFSPISSHGISNAIYCAKKASEAIIGYSKNKGKSLIDYELALKSIFNAYQKHKNTFFVEV